MSDTFLSRYVGNFLILHSPCAERKATVSDTYLSRYVGNFVILHIPCVERKVS